MTPPDRPKRPSARRSTVPPSPQPTAPSAKPAPAADEAGAAASEERSKGKKKARVAARRPSLPPPAPVASPAPAPVEPPAAPAPVEPEARVAAPERAAAVEREATPPPASTSAAAASSAPAVNGTHVAAPAVLTVGVQAEEPEAEAEENDDIWSESEGVSPVGFAALADADESEETPEAKPTRGAPAQGSVSRAARLARSRRDQDNRDEAVRLGSAQTLLSTDYYFRQYGAHGIRSLSADVDDFGLDPHAEERARPVLEALCKHYFRVDVDGAQHLPDEGRVLMVCNRSGALPWDGLVLRTALRMARPSLQPVRWLAEDGVFHSPFLGTFMNRLGAVRACPENAERLLAQDRLVAVFPEGSHGSSKLFKDRYRLQRFGRGGYVKLALKLGAPIVPTAIIGAEETHPLLAKSKLLGKALGMGFMPITPTFPWLGPAGLVPAPVKWRIVVGEPIDLSSYGPKAEGDALVVHRLNEQIRAILQSLVDQAKHSRRSVLFG